MQLVEVAKLETAGKFLCRSCNGDKESYLEFLASLNTYLESCKDDGSMFLPRKGQICAAYTSVGDSDEKLWYRGQIVCLLQSFNGFIARLFLVDEGHIVCVTKARMRRLSEKFETYPAQVIQCELNELVPLSLTPDSQLQMTYQKSNVWDNAATQFVEKIIQGKKTFINIVSEKDVCIKSVILYVEENQSYVSVNQKLVDENFAAFSTGEIEKVKYTPSPEKKVLREESEKEIKQPSQFSSENLPPSSRTETPKKPANTSKLETPTQFYFSSNTTNNVTKQSDEPAILNFGVNRNDTRSTLDSYTREREKQRKKQKEYNVNYANKDCEELLRILNDGESPEKSPHQKLTDHTSRGSDLSDMEITPAPRFTPYKPAIKTSNNISAGHLLENILGKESSQILTKSLDLSTDSSPHNGGKRVVFAAENDVHTLDSDAPKQFSFVDEKRANFADLFDASSVMQALSIGSTGGISKNNDILVHGKLKRDPFTRLNSLQLPLPLKRAAEKLGYGTPTTFQAHMYPAVAALRHIVGIPEPTKNIAPKTLSYMLPILKGIVEDNVRYKELGKGNGPFVIICVPGWEEAQQTYDVCEQLVENYKKKVRVDVFYGGMDKVEERNIRLINGCEVLIVTVSALLTILTVGYTNLKRINHVIFDNADVLVEKFTEDVKIFMRIYADTLKESKRVSSMQQVIVLLEKWSYGILSLTDAYLIDPLVVIGNKIEAALFANVPMVVQLCNSNERLDYLIGFLETDACEKNTIAFTNSANSADKLQQDLEMYSISTLVITEYKSPSAVKDARLAWNSSLKKKNNVLIMSDNAVLPSGIHSASYIVHYDFCQRKTHFGNRLNCLKDVIEENEHANEKQPLYSLIFITEKDNGMKYSTGIVKILKRAGQHVSEELLTMSISSREIKEASKEYSELCPRLKLFGYCNFIEDCDERHTVFPDRDLLHLCPSSGTVKVRVLSVISASSFWGRIVEHKLVYNEGLGGYDTTQYMKLAMDIQMHCSKKANLQICPNVELFDICITKTEDGFQRVRVEQILEKELERPKKLQVFGMDTSVLLEVQASELFMCPQHIKELPPQAVEMIVCCVKPVDHGISWTYESCRMMEKRCLGKTLEGTIKFSLQNSIWLDPLVEKEYLSGIQTTTVTFDVGRDLIQMGYAEFNKNHMKNLRKLLYDVQGNPMDRHTNLKTLPLSMIDHDTAFLCENKSEDVFVSAVEHPGLFYVQKSENTIGLEKLDDKINATMSVQGERNSLGEYEVDFPVGYICVAVFSGDKKWYRAKVLGMNKENGEYDVFFVDHGDRELVQRKHTAKVWDDILTPPFEAIECRCADVYPTFGQVWTVEEGDVMYDVTLNRLLSLNVLKTVPSDTMEGMLSYEVEIYDVSGNPIVNVIDELITAGAARGSQKWIQDVFPLASEGTKIGVTSCTDLCVEVYKSRDHEFRKNKCLEIKELVTSTEDNALLTSCGCIDSTSKLLTLIKEEDLFEIILSSLHYIATLSSVNTETFIKEGVLSSLCLQLSKSGADLQKLIVKVILQFTDNARNHLDHSFYNTICSIFKHTEDSEMIELTLRVLQSTSSVSDTVSSVIRNEGVFERIGKLLESEEDGIVDGCLQMLKFHLQNYRNQEYFRESGGLKVFVKIVKQKPTGKFVTKIMELVLVMVEDNIVNRDYLHKMGVQNQLKLYACLPRVPGKAVMLDLVARLSPPPRVKEVREMIKTSQEITVRKITEQKEDDLNVFKVSGVSPTVKWFQRSCTLTVVVEVKGVKRHEITCTPNALKFRTVVKQIEYVIDLQLYANICPKETEVVLKEIEVLIVLKKNNGEKWLRLLESKKKDPHVKIDHDRWLYSDEEETEETFATIYKENLLPPAPPCASIKPGDVLCAAPLTDPESSEDDRTSESEEEDFAARDYFKV